MTKRMLIDSTQPEETRVVVVNGNKLEDVEFETCSRKQIKGNIYLAKVMRVEPSLQAAFVDYGGNKHGFLAFGEIHPDYYNLSQKELEAIDKEVDDFIESKKQNINEREKARIERMAAQAEQQKARALKKEEMAVNVQNEVPTTESVPQENSEEVLVETTQENAEGEKSESEKSEKRRFRRRPYKNRYKNKQNKTDDGDEPVKTLADSTGLSEDFISEETGGEKIKNMSDGNDDDLDDDDDQDLDFEVQRKLLRARKLFHRGKIQDVIKEGQILMIQVVKEERGNKGAALTTYLSLAGRYCVLMPNRIKSGGVSRKITNASDRSRLKTIVKDLPLNADMSIIVRTAGEEKSQAEIVRDYNYLIRSWNIIRIEALKNKAPALIHEEGNLIKRALRDIYTKEIAEIIVAGENGHKMAKDFFKILSPHNLKKIKLYRNNEMPLFQRFQVETQLDRLHEATAQLESGGYLVINPTEALVAIDVNSGRATKEKDLEETALKTNLEACDEIARQLRMRNLAGLVVVDFIDMEEQSNNYAVEKRMKEALKKDRSRIQVGKMSCFGLLELSRQRLHSSFLESNYEVCPHCQGKGMVRTTESSAVMVLRGIEEEGIKGRSSRANIFVPSDVAVYLLNQKRQGLVEIEQRYKMSIIISADDSIQHISDYRIERIKQVKNAAEDAKPVVVEEEIVEIKAPVEERAVATSVEKNKSDETNSTNPNKDNNGNNANGNDGNYRNRRRDRNRGRRNQRHGNNGRFEQENNGSAPKPQEAVILYDSHNNGGDEQTKEKATWWKKLIKG